MKRLPIYGHVSRAALISALIFTGCASSTSPSNCPEAQVVPSIAAAPEATHAVADIAPESAPVWLSSWTDGPVKQRITAFVEDVTDATGPHFVSEAQRIAVFDNDGTLWVESPVYTQFAFVLDRVKELSGQHPEWLKKQPFQAAIENDAAGLAKLNTKQLLELVAASRAGTTTEEFSAIVAKWLKTTKSPKYGRPYVELVYQPMLELLDYLRGAGFKTYIASGGGVEFIRAFAEQAYGIPPEQVIGSSSASKYDEKENVLRPQAELLFVDDGPGKPTSINLMIGRRPIIAFGNSDGDYEMLAWSTSGAGSRLGAIIHHTDDAREAAYDRVSQVGQLARGLDDAADKGWLLVDMKQDWLTVFPKQ